MALPYGDWKWDLFEHLLPRDILLHIAAIKESVNHLLRFCPSSVAMWQQLVVPAKLDLFLRLEFNRWIISTSKSRVSSSFDSQRFGDGPAFVCQGVQFGTYRFSLVLTIG
ncbi:hypothetical protein V6N13_049001 [Hibiscus sabdariffa]